MAKKDTITANSSDRDNHGSEAKLFKTSDKLRGNKLPSDDTHVVLNLIFLTYISDAFEAKHQSLEAYNPHAAEGKDKDLARNIFLVPKEARWLHHEREEAVRLDAAIEVKLKNPSFRKVHA